MPDTSIPLWRCWTARVNGYEVKSLGEYHGAVYAAKTPSGAAVLYAEQHLRGYVIDGNGGAIVSVESMPASGLPKRWEISVRRSRAIVAGSAVEQDEAGRST